MPLVLHDVERKVTWTWAAQFVGAALVIFTPIYLLVNFGGVPPSGPLFLGVLAFVGALIPISKGLPKQEREVLRLREDGDLDVLLSKDPHQAVGSWWRHRIRVDVNALDCIRLAQSQATTSVPDVRSWYWLRLESGSKCLDTWVPDGVDLSTPEAMHTIQRQTGVPVVQEEPIGLIQASRNRRQQKKQFIPKAQWPG